MRSELPAAERRPAPLRTVLSRKVPPCPTLSAGVQLRISGQMPIARVRSKAVKGNSALFQASQASRFQACPKNFFKIHLTKSQSWFIIQAIENLKSHEPSGICNGEYPR